MFTADSGDVHRHSPYETLSDLSLGSLGLLLILVIVSLAMASPERISEIKTRLQKRIESLLQDKAELVQVLASEQERDLDAEVRFQEKLLESQIARISELQATIDQENTKCERLQEDIQRLLQLRSETLSAEKEVARYRVEMERLKLKLRSFERFEAGLSIDRTGRPHMKYSTALRNGTRVYIIGDRWWEPECFRAVLDSIRNGHERFFVQWEHISSGDWRKPEWASEEMRSWGWIPVHVEKKEGF